MQGLKKAEQSKAGQGGAGCNRDRQGGAKPAGTAQEKLRVGKLKAVFTRGRTKGWVGLRMDSVSKDESWAVFTRSRTES